MFRRMDHLQMRLRILLVLDVQFVQLSEHCMLGGGVLDAEATESESLLLQRLLLLIQGISPQRQVHISIDYHRVQPLFLKSSLSRSMDSIIEVLFLLPRML